MIRPTLALLFASLGALCAAEEHQLCEEGKCLAPLTPFGGPEKPGRKYARDRLVDIKNLLLDVTPDFKNRSVSGAVTLTFTTIGQPLTQFELDSIDIAIDAVESSEPLRDWHLDDDKLVLTFQAAQQVGAETKVTVRYHCQPDRGIFFRTPEMGYPEGDTQAWTQGEAENHRYWFPCYDYPNERFTTEVRCHAPEGMSVISNGKLLAKEKDDKGLTVWHWRQDKPHVNYLIALAVGYFHKIEDKLGALPLAMYVPVSEREQAAAAFQDTKAILEFYQKETGAPFPWDKYDQVYVHDFVAGGMENTSCSFMAGRVLYRPETEQLRSCRGLDAHESAHQWFGDLITCRDWSHIWLNEGFASYMPILFEEHSRGREAMEILLWKEALRVTTSADTRPMVWKDYKQPFEQFDTRAYPKGAWVLHMLRSQLGADLYRACIKTYIERHRFGIATSDDLQEVFEELSGRSFDQFFDQWVHHGGVPDLEATYSWDAVEKQAKVTIKQKQKVDTSVLLFRLPVPVRFFLKDEKSPWNFNITVRQEKEDFYFSLPQEPELMRLDPDCTILAKWTFNPPAPMRAQQLKSDFCGRMLAVQSLGEDKSREAVEQLKATLQNDTSYFVRMEAAKALQKNGSDAARSALAQSLTQPDARAREQVVQSLAAFQHAEARDAIWKLAQTEKNPDILKEIIQSWGARPGEPEIASALRKHLNSETYRSVTALAAVTALMEQDDAAAAPEILALFRKKGRTFPTNDYVEAIGALAFLGRRETNRDAVREFLLERLQDPKEKLRAAAATALGTLGDPKALAALRPLTTVRKPFNDPVREAAEKAIVTIASNQMGPPELQKLWQEIQTLQKKNQDLENEVKALKEKKAVQSK